MSDQSVAQTAAEPARDGAVQRLLVERRASRDASLPTRYDLAMTPLLPRFDGICRFSPPLDPRGGTVRRDGRTTAWWLILQCDPEWGRYLRHLYHLDVRRTRSISDPLWGPHVSIVQDEMPADLAAWKDREGATMSLELLYPPQEIGDYVFFPVRCEAALEYRERLGLPREPRYPLHLTIGNLK